MTTGRINQVTILKLPSVINYSRKQEVRFAKLFDILGQVKHTGLVAFGSAFVSCNQ